ncbi:MAG: redoxin domain-containing protein [Spirochaetia bacterium]|nr:redoxin domain-containing protein [Spirochaetia bacterium]
MNKKSRTLLISVISFVVLIVVASVAYNALRENAPSVAFTPQVAVIPQETPQAEPVQAPSPQMPSDETPEPQPSEPVQEPSPQTSSEETPEPATEAESEEPKMPNLPFFTLDGKEILFEEIRQGKPVVINYFASWCPPCKEELPHFQKAYESYGDKIQFIFLNAMDGQRETKATLEKFVEQTEFTGPIFTDEGLFSYVFQTNSLPTTVFINADGTLANGYLGYVSESVLIENLEALLTQE